MTQIIPPYMVTRARVAVIFAEWIAKAEASKESLLQTVLEDVRDEVLAAIDPTSAGGDAPRN